VQPSAPPPLARQSITASLSRNVIDFTEPTTASVTPPRALVEPTAPVFAHITLEPPTHRRGIRIHVLVNPPQGVANVGFKDPSYAATITFFGSHAHGHAAEPVTFDVPLTDALKKLKAAGRLNEGEPLKIQVVPATQGVRLSTFQLNVQSISISSS
jgi:tyrosinase